MVIKEFRELRRDRRTMAMVVFLPILLLVVFGYAANFEVEEISTAVLGPQAQQATSNVPDLFGVVETDPDGTAQTAEDLLTCNTADVAILTGTQPVQVYVDGSALFTAQAAVSALNRLGDQVEVEVLFNPDLTTAWVMVPGIVGLILMFVGTVVTSIGLVKERERGTLEQLAVMPIRPSTVILGKITPYFVLASADMIIVTVLGMLLFDVPFKGNKPVFFLISVLYVTCTTMVGLVVSLLVRTQIAATIITTIIAMVPTILFAGIFMTIIPALAILKAGSAEEESDVGGTPSNELIRIGLDAEVHRSTRDDYLFLAAGFYAANVIDAAVRRGPVRFTERAPGVVEARYMPTNVGQSMLLSAVVPGLGQVRQGSVGRGRVWNTLAVGTAYFWAQAQRQVEKARANVRYLEATGNPVVVVKSQIHAGGRGLGEGDRGHDEEQQDGARHDRGPPGTTGAETTTAPRRGDAMPSWARSTILAQSACAPASASDQPAARSASDTSVTASAMRRRSLPAFITWRTRRSRPPPCSC